MRYIHATASIDRTAPNPTRPNLFLCPWLENCLANGGTAAVTFPFGRPERCYWSQGLRFHYSSRAPAPGPKVWSRAVEQSSSWSELRPPPPVIITTTPRHQFTSKPLRDLVALTLRASVWLATKSQLSRASRHLLVSLAHGQPKIFCVIVDKYAQSTHDHLLHHGDIKPQQSSTFLLPRYISRWQSLIKHLQNPQPSSPRLEQTCASQTATSSHHRSLHPLPSVPPQTSAPLSLRLHR